MMILLFLLATVATNVHTFDYDFANLAFKKYAMIKVFEDCVGKDNVAKMFSEVKQAVAICGSKPTETAPFRIPDLTSAYGPSVSPTLFKQNQIEQKDKSVFTQGPLPIYFVRPVPPRPFDSVPYYPNAGHLRSDFGPYLQERMMYGYNNDEYDAMIPNRGFGLFRRAREATDGKEVTIDQPIPANPTATSESVGPWFEKYLLQNPKAQKIMQRLQYKMGNVTCVLQELRFLGADLQPDYDAIRGRIQHCPMDSAVKTEILEGVDTCKDFSQCVPTTKLSSTPAFKELARPLAFLQCLKGKKIEACMKKDLREKMETLLGNADWVSSRHSGDPEDEMPQTDEVEMFNMMFGLDIFSGQHNFF